MSPIDPRDLPTPADELSHLALDVALAAAQLVRERRREGFGVATKSTATDLVTDVDRASDVRIRELLAAARPDDGIVTEEDASVDGTTGIVWIADPIDGTTNFVYDHAPYAVSIAAAVDGLPVAGAVVEIRTDDRYRAALGTGSWRNGEQLVLAPPPAPVAALVATGFNYDPERRQRQGAVLAALIGRVRDVRRLGAASFDLCGVAAQRIDAYYEHGLGAWDIAAGRIIATEAGAAVEAVAGGPQTGDDVLAAHPDLIGPLRDLLIEVGADRI